jgi:di/tricarboxylate transporter
MSGDHSMKPSEKLYWIKAGLALIAAILCFTLQIYVKIDGTLIFMLGVLLYLASSDLLSGYLNLDRGHGLKVGVGAYIFIWVMVWTLLYTVFRTAPL